MQELKEAIQNITNDSSMDFFLYCGEINDKQVDQFIMKLRDKQNKNQNVGLILTTYGGDPDAGYRMTKAIKRYYSRFILYVFGVCKSTGTLIALGSDEIVMSDFSEFGPLDIQLAKDDELSNTSGLSYLQSLSSLNEQIFRSFESNFLSLKQKSGFTITTRTAAEIASKLAVGLISPISAQLDPVKLGEVQRAIMIADAYGSRLCSDRNTISKLIAHYPSHGFVIDYEEAKTIFPEVRFVNQHEARLERLLLNLVRKDNGTPVIEDLHMLELGDDDNNNDEVEENETQQVNEEQSEENDLIVDNNNEQPMPKTVKKNRSVKKLK